MTKGNAGVDGSTIGSTWEMFEHATMSGGISNMRLVGLTTTSSTATLSSITAGSYTESAKIWCHDCVNSGQATGSGTG